MRFFGELANVSLLSLTIRSLRQIAKIAIVNLTEDNMSIIIDHDENLGCTQVWTRFEINFIFSVYTVKSLRNNEISFELNLTNLYDAIKFSDLTSSVSLKLIKLGQNPFIRIEIKEGVDKEVGVTQNLPIRIMSPNEFMSHKEPEFADPDVQLLMPPLSRFEQVINGLSEIHLPLEIRANMGGEMVLAVRTEMSTTNVKFTDLEKPKYHNNEEELPNDPNVQACVTISIKELKKVLTCSELRPSNLVCFLYDSKYIIIYVMKENMSLLYFIPQIY
ncbi:checkpoint protein [Anaeramoeba flamelloides]|uniref:Checkpoint protein n=1 Tax=Anaeramoeba flamelloides TaxID=1746091 RepID=A0AAV7ZGR5_9EUKA|nr:checkpoint protein [Anaeramoeba flamelloides]KAJ6235321.1 checkpoint protein [Anaeramoeba flamelloides]